MTEQRQPSLVQTTPDRAAPPSPAVEPRPSTAVGPRRVLIACSEHALSESLERLIRHHAPDLWPAGVEVRRAADGIACLQLAELWRPDLVLLQPRLDRMSGPEVLEAWRRAHPDERLPAVALSSVFGSDVPPGAGFDAVLPVPWEGPALVEAVGRAFASSR